MEKNGDKKIRFGLRIKFILGLLIVGICITFAIVVIGVLRYKASITRMYNNTAYQVAAAAADLFTEQEMREYALLAYGYNMGGVSDSEIENVVESSRYKEIKALLVNLRKNMNANDIFVATVNLDVLSNFDREADERGEWNPLYYIMDSYQEEGFDFVLGDHSSLVEEFIDAIRESTETGIRPDDFLLARTQFGYNTTAAYPVVQNGETVAFVCVEIPVSTLEADIKQFLTEVVTAAGITATILLVLGIVFLVYTMIRPIVLIASEAEIFVQNNNIISDKLDRIKTHDEIQLLSQNLLKMEIGINEYIDNLTKVTAEKERIGAELNVATQIQADMLPSIFPAFPGRKEFDIYATMTPAKEVGGDFYDFFLIDEDHLGIVMADVSGKGVPAALFMVIAKTLIKNRAQMINTGGQTYSPAEILGFVNDQLCEGNEAELFVTVWLGILEISTGNGMEANAGHEHPAIRRADGQYELIKTKHSPAVATMEGMRFRENEFHLNPGDSLFVYTDGVAEATNSSDELFGTDRMLAALNEDPDATPARLLETVKIRIDAFVAETPQFDDITMLCLQYFGNDIK